MSLQQETGYQLCARGVEEPGTSKANASNHSGQRAMGGLLQKLTNAEKKPEFGGQREGVILITPFMEQDKMSSEGIRKVS